MTRDIEKNDVSLDELFRWNKEVTVEDLVTGNSVTLFMRLVGDADLNRARTYALRKSAELRRALKTKDTDERISFISELDEYKDKDVLISTIIILLSDDIRSRAMRDTHLPEPKALSSDASLEDQEEYQKKVDNYPQEFTKLVMKEIDKLQKVERKRLDKLSESDLQNEYEELIINRLCNAEMVDSFYDKLVFFGTYKDSRFRSRAFKSFDSFLDIAPKLKDKLFAEYKSLELGSEQLKK